MNILILSWRGPGHPQAGGAEIVTHEHAKAWVKAGHKVILFTSYFSVGKHLEDIDGVKILRSGSQGIGVKLQAFIWYFFKNQDKFDLVFDHFHGLPFFTPFYIKTKKVGFVHEVTKEVWRLNSWPKPFNLLPFLLGSFFEPYIFKLIYSKYPFITVSDSTKRDLLDWGVPEKSIHIIYNGVNTTVPKPFPQKETKKTVLFLGALTTDKGIEDAIEVFKLINEKAKDWQFWIVGRGNSDYLMMLKRIVQTNGLSSKVKFWGFVDERKKFELLARSHILINPSIREGWGLVNIEANAMGTPVVGYRSPGIVDSVKDNQTGFLVNIGDTKALTEKVLELLNDPKLYKKIQKNATAWSKKFNWSEKCQQSLRLIRKNFK